MESRKLALITGASSGIGFELAKVFAKNDYDLIIASSTAKINESAKILRQLEVDVTEVVADLSTQEGIDALYSRVQGAGRPLDVAVFNAGVGAAGEFIKTDFKDDLTVMNLNMVYTVGLCKKILSDMASRNEGKILFTSSIAAEMPGPYYATYAASKAFIQSFAEAIRFEMKETHKNVTITSLQPGPTDTNFFERADLEDTKVGQAKKDDPAQVAEQGFDALMAGKDHVVGGPFKNAVQAAASRFMSEEQAAKSHAEDVRPPELNH